MVHAYILIQTEVGKAAQVATTIAEIDGVTRAEDVTGGRADVRQVAVLLDGLASAGDQTGGEDGGGDEGNGVPHGIWMLPEELGGGCGARRERE